jgi:hypothetical protein
VSGLFTCMMKDNLSLISLFGLIKPTLNVRVLSIDINVCYGPKNPCVTEE